LLGKKQHWEAHRCCCCYDDVDGDDADSVVRGGCGTGLKQDVGDEEEEGEMPNSCWPLRRAASIRRLDSLIIATRCSWDMASKYCLIFSMCRARSGGLIAANSSIEIGRAPGEGTDAEVEPPDTLSAR